MKKELTELVFILDRSGSMSGLESDTIGGYNSLLKKQKKEDGECIITTVLFDDKYELLHDRINIRGVAPITEREYFVRGMTALLDAIGRTINKIVNAQMHTTEDQRPEKTMLVIITDGMENASREYGYDKVRKMIEYQKKNTVGSSSFGCQHRCGDSRSLWHSKDRAADYLADSEGIGLNYDVVSEAVTDFRAGHPIHANWKEQIDEDYRKRGRKKQRKPR